MNEEFSSKLAQSIEMSIILSEDRFGVGNVYPDLNWYTTESERKALPCRCPHASIHRCPNYFYTAALLSDEGILERIPKELHDATLAKWSAHELAPVITDPAPSISEHCHENFCPEVAFHAFKLFASTLIKRSENQIDTIPDGEDLRHVWWHIAPLHYSNCPMYAKLHQEKPMSNITFNGPVSGNVNVAGHSITAPVMSLSIAELLTKIETSNVPAPEKEAAKSKLAEFLAHPVVAAIIGGLAGKIGG